VNSERVLSLDISTKTGWNLSVSSDEGFALKQWGQIKKIEMPEGSYPACFVDWAYLCFGEIVSLIDNLAPDVLVIEETTASQSSHSQKILEFIHFLVAKLIKETSIKSIYILTGQWAKDVERKMSKEERDHNKYVKEYKEKHGDTNVAYDTKGKRIGKITKKHVSVRRANELFGKFLKEPLRMKDEDTAEGLLLGYSYHLRRLKNENTR
jgi:hypothetical protein